ncbi:hypothetical protein [Novosphingobium sp. 9]|uniref:hypothetical protein n=1 Tax=Novosphingobium sp. 9 TaxID=2025349 RepID=UPI0021B52064|nr:hypothetical protein [Novosphingobium sp. 9]
MAEVIHTIDALQIGMSIKVRFPRGFRLRVHAAAALLRLVGTVAPVATEIEVEVA